MVDARGATCTKAPSNQYSNVPTGKAVCMIWGHLALSRTFPAKIKSYIPRDSHLNSRVFCIFCHCFTSICFHSDFLSQKIHNKNKLHRPLFFTGIPRSIQIFAKVNFLGMQVKIPQLLPVYLLFCASLHYIFFWLNFFVSESILSRYPTTYCFYVRDERDERRLSDDERGIADIVPKRIGWKMYWWNRIFQHEDAGGKNGCHQDKLGKKIR